MDDTDKYLVWQVESDEKDAVDFIACSHTDAVKQWADMGLAPGMGDGLIPSKEEVLCAKKGQAPLMFLIYSKFTLVREVVEVDSEEGVKESSRDK